MDEKQEDRSRRKTARRPSAFSLGSLLGIPIYVDYSWLLIFALITLTLSQHFTSSYPDWVPAQAWLAGVVTSLLFFACVFLHEMGHSLVARSFGIPVVSITLFVFGGVAQIKNEPRKPSHEFLIAIAGPLTSVALAIFFALIYKTSALLLGGTPKNPPMISSISLWLASINIILAVFNMVPGFPLDGGRVLRSILWALSGRFEQATRIAANVGSFIAYFLIALGIFLIFKNQFIQGVWIAFIGWFLLTAARSSVVQLVTRQVFSNLRVADIIEQIPYRISPAISIQALVNGPILQHGHRTFVVEDNGVLLGLVTLHEIKATPREEWAVTPVQSIMIPARDLVVVEPTVSLETVVATMDERGVNQMPVVEGDRVIGMVTREGLLRVLRNQLDLGIR